MSEKNVFGYRVLRALDENRYKDGMPRTATALAEVVGFSKSYVSDLINKEEQPDLKVSVLALFADALKISYTELIPEGQAKLLAPPAKGEDMRNRIRDFYHGDDFKEESEEVMAKLIGMGGRITEMQSEINELQKIIMRQIQKKGERETV